MGTRKHELSQNFLRSPRIAGELIGHSKIRKRDLVVEVGAGSGVITTTLARRAREVWAIEPDAVACAKLRANLARQGIENMRVFQKGFQEVALPMEPYKVLANPPFHLAAEILYWLFGLENNGGEIREILDKDGKSVVNRPEGVWLVLQKQMALKMIPTDRHYTSQLGKILMREYDCRIRLPLRKTDFTPPPKVPVVFWEAKRRKNDCKGESVLQ